MQGAFGLGQGRAVLWLKGGELAYWQSRWHLLHQVFAVPLWSPGPAAPEAFTSTCRHHAAVSWHLKSNKSEHRPS